ncbi:DUF1617 family protein [Geobacillus thermodenitrificans]|jgi:predicted RNase H-like nuclease (RuvC/YqgF family)|uniref:DUF1617 family protein n=1 Tax=Geobacillus thermodenitrificans TaxID=33940 RepID=A0ABY9QCZ2_GEOTD|nr:DUF1617 family protein [Geobacillus thermodenitrificans]MED4916705.1 DUF1617 family protein [Geobacillus thermodenitrificans]UYL94224.1 hypothetical protein PT91_gp19 [Geobacillus phage vB_GthS_PT9.1]WMV75299.1 DUF1617 family protein [Geobacillus thermodenitrificans]
MIVRIEKSKLAAIINLLYDLPLKGKQSRHRTKFIKLLHERLEEYREDIKQLLKEHCNLDESGEPVVKDDNTYDVKDIEAYIKDKKELDEEEIVIEGGDVQGMLKTVKEILFNCDREFRGEEAMIYDYICEKFEEGEGK